MALAKNITIDYKTETVTIDGEVFDFLLAAEDLDVTSSDISIVRLPILAESVTILPARED